MKFILNKLGYLVGLAALFGPQLVFGQVSNSVITDIYTDAGGPAKIIAQEAWNKDKETIRDEDLAGFGFKSRAELSEAKLGDPIPIFTLQQFTLAKYDQTRKLFDMLSPALEIKYPLVTSNGPVAAISVVKIEGHWVPGILGDRHITALLHNTFNKMRRPGTILIAAEIPSLHKYLIVDSSRIPTIRALIDADGTETQLSSTSIANYQWDFTAQILTPTHKMVRECRRLTPQTSLTSKTAGVLSSLAEEVRSLEPPSK